MTGLLLAVFLNLCLPITRCDAAWTNASAHVGWAVAVPLIGEKVAGSKGKWIFSSLYLTGFLVRELAFHGGDWSEKRTDLITGMAPTLLVLPW